MWSRVAVSEGGVRSALKQEIHSVNNTVYFAKNKPANTNFVCLYSYMSETYPTCEIPKQHSKIVKV